MNSGIKYQRINIDLRRAILERANYQCEDCKTDIRRLRYGKLEMHHLHYETRRNETEADLIALCRNCHHHRHIDVTGTFHCNPANVKAVNDAWEKGFFNGN